MRCDNLAASRIACQQGDFEIDGVVVTGADHRERIGDLGGVQIISDCCELATAQPDNFRASSFQLFDDGGGQRIVTADNDVMLHSLIRH